MMNQNNFFNIEPAGWMGELPSGNRFAKFDTSINGIRAFFLNLKSYINRDGVITISDFVDRYAPSSENDTVAYVKSLAGNGFDSADNLTPANKDWALGFAKAVAMHENSVILDSDSLDYAYEMIFGSGDDSDQDNNIIQFLKKYWYFGPILILLYFLFKK